MIFNIVDKLDLNQILLDKGMYSTGVTELSKVASLAELMQWVYASSETTDEDLNNLPVILRYDLRYSEMEYLYW